MELALFIVSLCVFVLIYSCCFTLFGDSAHCRTR